MFTKRSLKMNIKISLMKFMLYRDFDMLELTNRLKEVRKNMDYLSKGQVLDMSTLTDEEQVHGKNSFRNLSAKHH